jgi:hypothetical protein
VAARIEGRGWSWRGLREKREEEWIGRRGYDCGRENETIFEINGGGEQLGEGKGKKSVFVLPTVTSYGPYVWTYGSYTSGCTTKQRLK